MVKIFLGLTSQHQGFAEGAMGVGAIVGGLLAGVFAKKVPFNRSYRFLLTAVLLVLPAAASVESNAHPMVSYGVLLASVLGCMAGATLFNSSAQTFIQQQTPDRLIGKVMSCVSVIAVCTLPIGQAMYGFLFEAFKERIFLVVLFAAVMGLVIALAVRHILRRVPSPQAMDLSLIHILDHHRVVGIEVFLAPGLFKQLLAGQHPPPVFAQQPQQVEFDGGQYQGLIVQGAGVGFLVDDQPVEIDDRGFLRPLVVPGGPAQLGLDPVSYTHLDVYKRQVKPWERWR